MCCKSPLKSSRSFYYATYSGISLFLDGQMLHKWLLPFFSAWHSPLHWNSPAIPLLDLLEGDCSKLWAFLSIRGDDVTQILLGWRWHVNNIVPRCVGDKRTENPFLYRENFLLSPWGHSHPCHPWKVRRWMVNPITLSLSTWRIWTTLRLQYAEYSLSVYAWVDKAPFTCNFLNPYSSLRAWFL